MSKLDVIRAWKDEEYFNRLSESERSLLPENPAGVVEVTDEDLRLAEGGTTFSITVGCNSLVLCPFTLGCPVSVTITPEILRE